MGCITTWECQGSNGRMSDKWWTGRCLEENVRGRMEVSSSHFLEGLRKTMGILSQDSRCSAAHSNREPNTDLHRNRYANAIFSTDRWFIFNDVFVTCRRMVRWWWVRSYNAELVVVHFKALFCLYTGYIEDSRSAGRNSYPRHPDHEAGVKTTQLQSST
jgi:hypothetical protein